MAKLFKLLSNNTFALNESVIKEETGKMTRERAMRIASSLTPQELQDMTDWLKELSFADVDADDLDDIAKEEPWKIVMVVSNSYDGGLSAWWKDSINEIDLGPDDFHIPRSGHPFDALHAGPPPPYRELRIERYTRIGNALKDDDFDAMVKWLQYTNNHPDDINYTDKRYKSSIVSLIDKHYPGKLDAWFKENDITDIPLRLTKKP